jgi:hypothetical protein
MLGSRLFFFAIALAPKVILYLFWSHFKNDIFRYKFIALGIAHMVKEKIHFGVM